MTDKIRSVIIDDDEGSLLTLSEMLKKYCPEILLLGTAQSVQNAIILIDSTSPDLIFLDISLPDGTGFEVLSNINNKNTQVIFTTGHDDYAMKAFEFSALHYLMKPIKRADLHKAISRFENNQPDNILDQKIKIINDSLNNQHKKIILPTSDGFNIIDIENIMRCESSNNYTTIYLNSGERIVVSKPISNYELLLADLNFVRVHSKHLINLKYVKRYIKGRGGYVILNDNSHVDVSEGKKKDFLVSLSKFAMS